MLLLLNVIVVVFWIAILLYTVFMVASIFTDYPVTITINWIYEKYWKIIGFLLSKFNKNVVYAEPMYRMVNREADLDASFRAIHLEIHVLGERRRGWMDRFGDVDFFETEEEFLNYWIGLRCLDREYDFEASEKWHRENKDEDLEAWDNSTVGNEFNWHNNPEIDGE